MSRLPFTFVVLCIALLAGPEHSLHAQELKSSPGTIRTETKQYITTGSVTIPVSVDAARRIIGDTGQWNDWMFTGIDGTEPSERFLLVYIPGVCFTTPDKMTALVEFRFLRSFGKDPSLIPFVLARQYTEDGKLSGITAVLEEKNAMVYSARYEISVTGSAGQTIIDYSATVRLRGFFEFFVTRGSYSRTIEWYLDRIIGNFARRTGP